MSLLGRTRSCRTRRLFPGRRSTAKGGSGVRGCSPSSRGRANLQGPAGCPVSSPLSDVAAVCARRLTDETIKPKLLEVFDANYRVYGRRKMKATLRREHHINLDKDRIARLMRELGIRGATRTRGTVTTRSDRSSPRAPDLVNRQFKASRPNQLWACDFTYVPTWSGFAYTAFVTDVYSRMIVGWRTAATMTADLITVALEMAIFSRRHQLLRGVIAHSDGGSQPGFKGWSQHCLDEGSVDARRGLRRGSSSRGSCGADRSARQRVDVQVIHRVVGGVFK